jgi:large subunit ribosomal protein L15
MGGQTKRSGFKYRAWFEGGQMPLQRRLPKVGFKPISRVEYQIVNLSSLAGLEAGSEVGPAELAAKGWIKDAAAPVKILGDGELKGGLKLTAHKFSKSAVEKIEKAGGTVTVLDLHPKSESTPSEN